MNKALRANRQEITAVLRRMNTIVGCLITALALVLGIIIYILVMG